MGGTSRGVKSTFNKNNFSNVALYSQNRKNVVKVKHESTKKVQAVRERGKICDTITITLISLIVVGVGIYVAYLYTLMQNAPQSDGRCSKLKVLIIDELSNGTMSHVFENLGFDVLVSDENSTAITLDWNLLWSTAQDPFERHMIKLKPHQLVNHFPSLSQQMNIMTHVFTERPPKVVSRAFKLPEMKRQLMDYVSEKSRKKFIIRDCLATVDIADVNYDTDMIVQDFVGDPLIIDGHIFDFGVYVLVTSVDPLRIYRYNGEVRARFSVIPSDAVQFFCHNGEFSAMNISALAKCRGYSVKHSIESHLAAEGFDVRRLYENIDETTVTYFMMNEAATKLKGQHYFQLMRIDFLIEKSLNVHIKDVKTEIHLSEDNEVFEEILYATLNIMGAGNFNDFKLRENLESPMLPSVKGIAVHANSCINYPCNESCSAAECELCLSCLTQVPGALKHLYRSYREHTRRGNMKRIFPAEKHYHDSVVNQLSPTNRLSTKWFRAKCDADGEWC